MPINTSVIFIPSEEPAIITNISVERSPFVTKPMIVEYELTFEDGQRFFVDVDNVEFRDKTHEFTLTEE